VIIYDKIHNIYEKTFEKSLIFPLKNPDKNPIKKSLKKIDYLQNFKESSLNHDKKLRKINKITNSGKFQYGILPNSPFFKQILPFLPSKPPIIPRKSKALCIFKDYSLNLKDDKIPGNLLKKLSLSTKTCKTPTNPSNKFLSNAIISDISRLNSKIPNKH